METMGAVNKCRSAALTNRLSSGTRCHRGIAEAPQRSLCVASHSHPSSQLIRLIFTSITAVNHTGKCFCQGGCVAVRVCVCVCVCVCVEWGIEHASMSSCTSVCRVSMVLSVCVCVCVCVQAGKALNICLSSLHPARLTSEVFLSPYWD